MSKIIIALRNDANDKNIAKANAYLQKHMMASCMLSIEDAAFLRSLGIKL